MKIDIHSDTWLLISSHCQDRRERAVSAILAEGSNVDRLRGEVAALDEILALPTDAPPPPILSPKYD